MTLSEVAAGFLGGDFTPLAHPADTASLCGGWKGEFFEVPIRHNVIFGILLAAGIGMSPASQAAGVSPATKQAQSKLAILGFDPGTADGILGRHTITAIKAFQEKSGLPVTGTLDSATLAKLDIGVQVPQVSTVND